MRVSFAALGLATIAVLTGCSQGSEVELEEELGSAEQASNGHGHGHGHGNGHGHGHGDCDDDDADFELRSKNQTILWEGAVSRDDAPLADAPPECDGQPCDHFTLDVDLPNGTFNNPQRPGGLQVALRWFGNPGGHTLPPGVPGCCGEFDTLHLWIYKDGELVGASAGIIAVSQSALIPSPEDGVYDIYVQYDASYNIADTVEYEALAEVEFQPKKNPNRRLLPDLTFRSTERITFDTPSFPIFEEDPPAGSSCFNSERDEDGAQSCLRFDQIVANDGQAPAEISWQSPTNPPEDYVDFPVSQTVYYSNGTTQDQPGGEVNFHGIHGHYHYSSFANAALWRSNAQGKKLGNAPLRTSHKVSFCMADIRIDAWGEKGDGPRKYMAPDCLFPQSSDGVTDTFRQGISNGWSDVYDWYIPDQYIEVSGITDGYYRLEFCADPFNELEETNESNNCIANHIKLSNMAAPDSEKVVKVLGVVR